MSTASGHTTAIRASKVKGTDIFNTTGDKIGKVEDVILDKLSGKVLFAAIGFGGVLGMGEKYAPVPWSVLDYDEDKEGYVVPLSEEVIKQAPVYSISDLVKSDANLAKIRDKSYDYYKVTRDW